VRFVGGYNCWYNCRPFRKTNGRGTLHRVLLHEAFHHVAGCVRYMRTPSITTARILSNQQVEAFLAESMPYRKHPSHSSCVFSGKATGLLPASSTDARRLAARPGLARSDYHFRWSAEPAQSPPPEARRAASLTTEYASSPSHGGRLIGRRFLHSTFKNRAVISPKPDPKSQPDSARKEEPGRG
jgi:hypothetical protein